MKTTTTLSSPLVSLSIVSHGQGALVRPLLEDIRSWKGARFQILLTINIPENIDYLQAFDNLEIKIINNKTAKGFGENHNAAFVRASGSFFVVLNPDIRSSALDFKPILDILQSVSVGACAPLVFSPEGQIEDSARRFPTFFRLAKRVILNQRSLDYIINDDPVNVDWVAGMFIAFRSDVFALIGGFDSRFHMYLEDADMCRRLRHRNLATIVTPLCRVVHDAQRASRKKIRYMIWHYRSAFRYLFHI